MFPSLIPEILKDKVSPKFAQSGNSMWNRTLVPTPTILEPKLATPLDPKELASRKSFPWVEKGTLKLRVPLEGNLKTLQKSLNALSESTKGYFIKEYWQQNW